MAPASFGCLNVVLVRTRNPLNIGAAARAMSNFGFSGLKVVAPYEVAFREARSAVGASDILQNAGEFQNVADAVAECSLVVGTTAAGARRLAHSVKALAEGCLDIRDGLAAGPVALLFGSEKRGLSNDDLSYCHWAMRIPTEAAHRSMNLGQAVAVCLYELARPDPVFSAASDSSALGSSAPGSPANAAELERMTQRLFHALCAGGYIKPGAGAVSLEKARRLVRRMGLNREDTETLTGMLAKIGQALDTKKR